MDKPLALVTGGNSGIGFECARQLARDGWRVVVASRNRDASIEAVAQIAGESGDDSASEMVLDLGSLDAVRDFVREYSARELPLNALVLNAGIQIAGERRMTPDGFESTFAVNHLGHFLLTHMLLSRLRDSAPSRIVVVASGVHDPALFTGMPKPNIDDFDTLARSGAATEEGFEGRLAYVNSKLCNMWFAYELDRRIRAAGLDITVNGYDPGLVPGSGLARDYTPALRWIWDNVLPAITVLVSAFTTKVNRAERSGQALARLVTNPELAAETGKYYPSHTAWAEAPSSEDSYDEARARELWEKSILLSRLQPEETLLS